MKNLLDNVSTDVEGAAVKVVGRCTFFVRAANWDGATVTIKGRGSGATDFIVMGELAARTSDGPVTADVEGPWEVLAEVTGAGGSTAGIVVYANQ